MSLPCSYTAHISAAAASCSAIWYGLDQESKKALQAACLLVHSDTRWYLRGLGSVIDSESEDVAEVTRRPSPMKQSQMPSAKPGRDAGFFEIVD